MYRSLNAQEILTIALRIEENGARFYQQAFENATDATLKAALNKLRQWEEGHILFIQQLIASDTPKTPLFIPSFYNPEATSDQYIKAIADAQVFVESDSFLQKVEQSSTSKEILHYALSFETITVAYYQSLLEILESSSSQKKIALVLAEEQTHVTYISELLAQL